jgi:hypothetical protein
MSDTLTVAADRVQAGRDADALLKACLDNTVVTSSLAMLAVQAAGHVKPLIEALERAQADTTAADLNAARESEANRDLRRRINGALALIGRATPSDTARCAVLPNDLRLALESSRDTAEVAA